MLKNIIKQVWNQRRMNGWILLELIIAGFFLWTVIDPVYVLMVNHFTPKGYEEENRFVLNMGAYGNNHAKRDTTVTQEQQKEAFLHAVRQLRNCPEVESVCLAPNSSFPNGGSWSGTQYYADTTQIAKKNYVHTQSYNYLSLEGGNIFQTYGMKDAFTGGDLIVPEDAETRGLIFVSEGFAKHMFGTIDVVGKKITSYNKQEVEIGGVFKDYKHREYQPPYPLVVNIQNSMRVGAFMHYMYMPVFKLKDGVNSEAFIDRFEKEVAPHLSRANFYYKEITTFKDQRIQYAELRGYNNVIRLKLALAGFTLLCIFLGMVGTFWVRCNARRQEVGLMKSFGATKTNIISRFFSESALLVSVAFIISFIALAHYAMEGNMTEIEVAGMPQFATINWFLKDTPRFCMISLITYLLLLVISLIGTAIPVIRAAKVLPADALRDE
ncbi:MAG: ABC transporter permease [Bacteroidaceae bacterium]|nr:ABC transporter permease [Bacteroidaceae bacterium]